MTTLNNQLSLITFFAVALGIILICALVYLVYYLRSSGKDKERYLYLKISEDFERQIESMIEKELKDMVVGLNQKALSFSDEIAETYKKEVATFFRGVDGEFSKISKVNEKIQDSLLREAEKKMDEFDKGYSQAQSVLFDEVRSTAAEAGKTMSEEISKIHQSTEESLKQKNIQIKKDIENYKEEKLRELDKEIYKIISEVAQKTIGKATDLSTHEELVMEALEKAKKEQIF